MCTAHAHTISRQSMWIYFVSAAILLCSLYLVARRRNVFDDGRRTLFVTAHPDDECMFFAPSILAAISRTEHVYLLCLSDGNYYKQGDVRILELVTAAGKLGIPHSNIHIVRNKNLPDDPEIDWDEGLVGQFVKLVARKWQIERIVTFDEYGISGHRNHAAISRAIRTLGCNEDLTDSVHGEEVHWLAGAIVRTAILRQMENFLLLFVISRTVDSCNGFVDTTQKSDAVV